MIAPDVYEAAMKAARKDIERSSQANSVMVNAVVAGMLDDPGFERERRVATLVSSMMKADSTDVLLMWAVLVVERAEVIRDGR